MNTLLADLADGAHATVASVCANGTALGEAQLRRLGELGFLPGEPVQVLHRGPGGREPLAVVVGDTMFALRLAEARCVMVNLRVDITADITVDFTGGRAATATVTPVRPR